MAEFQEVIKEYHRLCESVSSCRHCPIRFVKDEKLIVHCRKFMTDYPEHAERIIMQWASEHPIMTNRRKFAETFGFDVETMFEVNRGNAGWLDEKYKETK